MLWNVRRVSTLVHLLPAGAGVPGWSARFSVHLMPTKVGAPSDMPAKAGAPSRSDPVWLPVAHEPVGATRLVAHWALPLRVHRERTLPCASLTAKANASTGWERTL